MAALIIINFPLVFLGASKAVDQFLWFRVAGSTSQGV